MAREKKWTPGPWTIAHNVWGMNGISTVDLEKEITPHLSVRSEEEEANAYLIAAAPDLVEALESLYERYIACIGNEGPEASAARQALARAYGETK